MTTDGEVLAPLSPVRRFWTQLLHLVPTTGMWGEEWLCIHVHTHSEDRRWHDEGAIKSTVCDVCILGTPCLDTSKTSMVSFGRASPLSTHHRDVWGRVAAHHLKRLWLETWKSSSQRGEDMLKPAETKGQAPVPPALKSRSSLTKRGSRS